MNFRSSEEIIAARNYHIEVYFENGEKIISDRKDTLQRILLDVTNAVTFGRVHQITIVEL